MYQKRKYKHFILLCLVLDLLTMVFLGYRYLDRKIPDEIHIDKNSGLDLSQISNLPFVSFGDTITQLLCVRYRSDGYVAHHQYAVLAIVGGFGEQ